MTICLNEAKALEYGLDVGALLALIAIENDWNLETFKEWLIQEEYITKDYTGLFNNAGYRVTNKGKEVLINVILDSDPNPSPKEPLLILANKLKEIFPKGKKPGTNYYWADGAALIVRRLKLFFKKYGNLYTDEQILEAAKKYVEGFNGNYHYMRLLKYFIFKEQVGANGEIEGTSELISYIENHGQEDTLGQDWSITLK